MMTKMTHIWRALLGLTCILAVAAIEAPAAAEDLPGKDVHVKTAYCCTDNDLFPLFVLSRGLEKLGYVVDSPLLTTIPVMYLAVGQHEADITHNAWTPLQDNFYAAAGGNKTMERVGVLIRNAKQGYLIDKATADKYHITNLSQFNDSAIAKLFDTTGDGKASLIGCDPGWGCERVIEHQLSAYGLRATVSHVQGNYQALIADTLARYKQGQPILYYTWTPLWLSGVLVPGKDVIWLDVPFSSLPDDPKANTALTDGRNSGFPPNDVTVVANKDFLDKNPSAKRLFERVQIPLDDVNTENLEMYRGEKTIKDVWHHADLWIAAHQQVFDGWIAYAMKP
jgi:glycine betaine/proline transport system substrate-binding protein